MVRSNPIPGCSKSHSAIGLICPYGFIMCKDIRYDTFIEAFFGYLPRFDGSSVGVVNYHIMRIPLPILIAGSLFLLANGSPAMDRWSALSMIESGDDDLAVGPGGEVSRFQIRRELWPGGNSRNAQEA